ncbi:MAG TPA: response regulator transcription factor [Desulfuromonadales bacterium]|nr:response regulator transcription factor [Desulfuromonadales bacterium]
MYSILIFEDDETSRIYMESVLKQEGFDVRCALDGQSGLDLLYKKRPDLILCDIMMPNMDGHAVLEAVKNERAFADIPFIFVTGQVDRADQRRGMCEGADDYLTKPFTSEELVSAVVSRLYRIGLFRQQGENAFFQAEIYILRHQTTDREREVLQMVGQGVTSKEIARRLDLRPNTVEVHRANLMRKLDAPNAASLARWAFIAEQIPSG